MTAQPTPRLRLRAAARRAAARCGPSTPRAAPVERRRAERRAAAAIFALGGLFRPPFMCSHGVGDSVVVRWCGMLRCDVSV
eukprot:scaffold125263_cov63-Phaeocystis_antarctica.AAC.3